MSSGDYATAGSFNIHNDQLINSTMNIPDYGSDGSAEMSIELGRGGRTRARDNDISSNLIFDLGNNSQYEVTGTPPIKSRPNDLRREASLRRATSASKGRVQHRSLSETLARLDAAEEEEEHQATATFQPRNTRFVRSRQASANQMVPTPSRFAGAAEGTPRRATVNNPTVQSATYTANSFQLPDMPNITELVRSPVVNRTTRSRSRFTSASYRALHTEHTTEHAAIESVPIPDEEKAIYASLQMLKDRVAELEMDKAELLSQLQAQRRRPASPLGSDDEETARGLRGEKTKLQTSVKSLQSRLEKTERKVSVSEITIKRVAKERDQLAAQVELTLHDNDQLRADVAELREELAILRQAIYGMERRPSAPKRVLSESAKAEPSHRDGTTQLEVDRRRTSAKATERRASASPVKRDLFETEEAEPTQTENGTQVDRDLTELSFMDPQVLAQLRKKIEEEHKSRHERPAMPRKSSLKDITAGLENATGRFSLNGEEETVAKAAKTVRVQSPHPSDASFLPQQQQQAETGDTSMLSNTSRRRRRAASAEGMTSAFILPDITLHSSQAAGSTICIHHASSTCTACHPTSASISIPKPTPVSERIMPEDLIDTTLRPAESPTLALATVIKNLEDEIMHLKIQLHGHEQAYLRHDPSASRRVRLQTRKQVQALMEEVERRSEQVYRLYDVLEGQRSTGAGAGSGRDGQGEGGDGGEETEELPFEGLSEDEEGGY
ncbi:hypothetical protein LTR85_002551 [Meristemomyces frigidus]|nr:hypothetical protein LTR85_002551 [Meristemomyces frigidus]